MMIRTDLSSQYKTKFCKKYQANGYCPYGQRCLFIHDQKESYKPPAPKPNIEKIEIVPLEKKNSLEEEPRPVKELGVNYSELLVHNINVSLQEHHKKLFVYNKKSSKTKDKKLIEKMPSPGL